jgi:hypothetical protein
MGASASFTMGNKLKLKNFYMVETPYVEHKEFTILSKSFTSLPRQLIQKYSNGYYDDLLYSIICDNICYYIRKYYPAYLSACSNSDVLTDNKYVYLNIGITDDGYISGIPIKNTKTSSKLLTSLIRKTIDNMCNDETIVAIQTNSNLDMEEYIKKLCDDTIISIIELDKNCNHKLCDTNNSSNNQIQNIIIETNNIVNSIKLSIDNHKNALEQYKKELKAWLHNDYRYGCKLSIILNDLEVRDEYIEFVCLNHPNILILDPLSLMIMLDNIMHIYGSKKTIHITPSNYMKTMRIFRDTKRKELNPLLPKKVYKKPNIDPLMVNITRITSLIDKINNVNGENVKYVLIQIKIPININKNIIVGFMKDGALTIKKRKNRIVSGRITPENCFTDVNYLS